MVEHYGARYLREQRVKVISTDACCADSAFIYCWFGQFHWLYRTWLVFYELVDALYFRSIYECTLHADRCVAVENEHVSASYQLFRALLVENCARVNHGTYLERHTSREVRLDVTCDDSCGRSLCRNYHVDTHGACKLGDTSYRHLYLFARCHDQIAKLIDNNNDIWHVLMTFFGIQLVVNVHGVILLDVSNRSLLKHAVAVVHQRTKAV